MQSLSTMRAFALIAVLTAPLALAQTQTQTQGAKRANRPARVTPEATTTAGAQPMTTANVQQDIRDTFGMVPSFLRALPDDALPGAWQAMKGLQLNPNTELPGKYKELIGLAVAAQIPCQYCIYFHTEAAKAMGATDDEVKEALTESALTREASTVINGTGQDPAAFRAEVDRAMGGAAMGGAGQAGMPCPDKTSASNGKAMGATPEQMKAGASASTHTQTQTPMQMQGQMQNCPQGSNAKQMGQMGMEQGTGGSATAGTRPSGTMTPPPMEPAPDAVTASKEMEQTMGGIPTFMSHVPDAMRAGLWNQWKFEMSNNTAVPAKYKSLMSLAVAAQIPCAYCVYADRKAAKMAGASDQEMDEAIGMAALTRYFSTILNGTQTDPKAFKAEAKQLLKNVGKKTAMGGAGKAGTPMPESPDKIDKQE